LVSFDASVTIEEKLGISELVGEAKVTLATVVLPRLTTPLREDNDAETVERLVGFGPTAEGLAVEFALGTEEVEIDRLKVEDSEVKVDDVSDEEFEFDVRLRDEVIFVWFLVSTILDLVSVPIEVLVASVDGAKEIVLEELQDLLIGELRIAAVIELREGFGDLGVVRMERLLLEAIWPRERVYEVDKERLWVGDEANPFVATVVLVEDFVKEVFKDLNEDFVIEIFEDPNENFDDRLLEVNGLFGVVDRAGSTKTPEVGQVASTLPESVAFSKA
jgi:hypothetical protein